MPVVRLTFRADCGGVGARHGVVVTVSNVVGASREGCSRFGEGARGQSIK